jgi:D-alanyl-D-alanine dipeptidase
MKRSILKLLFVSAVLVNTFLLYCSCDTVSEYNNKADYAQNVQTQGSIATPTSTAAQGSIATPTSTAAQGSIATPTSTAAQGSSAAPTSTAAQGSIATPTSTAAQGSIATPTSTAAQASSIAQTSNSFVTPSNVEMKTHALNEEGVFERQGLVKLEDLDTSFVIDLKYATEDNFTGKVIYSKPLCVIHKETAKKLIAANNEFKELGYRLKIFDAYRPFSAQQTLWDATDNKSFVANPQKGSIHNRGAAVDVTLVDEAGNEIEMPSGYDEFSERAALDYKDCPKNQIENRELLGKIMVKHGFRRINNEWWHFEDTNAKNYPIRDISFEEFEEMG